MKIDKNRKELSGIKESKISEKPLLEDDLTEKAVAFKIEDDEAVVTSIGIGNFAKQIKKEAEKHDIPVYKEKELTEKLINFDINVPLPPSAYNLILDFINFVSMVEWFVVKKKNNL
ncbi:MAG: EscU/YscU/HrcU family type III secretion system export apparatus switch protein [bacterium]